MKNDNKTHKNFDEMTKRHTFLFCSVLYDNPDNDGSSGGKLRRRFNI